jgi:peptide deformylase
LSAEKEADYEGCLNTGELMGEVPRAKEIEYAGYDLDGNHLRKRATGLEARILQHEIDHLNGILFVDRVENKETFTTHAELKKAISNDEAQTRITLAGMLGNLIANCFF